MTRPMISCIFLLLLTLQCLYQVQAWRSVRLNRYVQRSCTSLFAKVPDDSEDEVVPIKNLAGGMRRRLLPHSDLKVSEIAIGTMNFGDQVKKETSFQILDKGTKDYGINFIDTAEMFPSPPLESTKGLSEKFVGEWLKQHPKSFRKDVLLCTKVCGNGKDITWMRKDKSPTRLTRKQIEEAVDGSLERLQTDYIDVLSFHWPDRYVVWNGAESYYEHLQVPDATPILEQLQIVQDLIKKGKIRHFALTNETPYGIGAFTATADNTGLPRPVAVQSQYSLLDRYDFELGMKEAVYNAKMPVMAYSPLAGGALTGKYNTDFNFVPDDARMKLFAGFYARYITQPCKDAIRSYMEIAKENFVPFTPMALAWVYQQSFVTSTILGVTSVAQLDQNIRAKNLSPLNENIMAAFDKIYRQNIQAGRGPSTISDPRIERFDPRRRPWGLREAELDPRIAEILDEMGEI